MLNRNTLVAATLFALRARAVDNGLARTPQMGWNNWNTFGCAVDAELLEGTAQKIVDLGFRDAGYHYVVLDDCWSDGRDDKGALKWNATKFPEGIKAVADKLHNLDLGMGIYSDAGSMTCGRFAGSLGHEELDAKTWAEWGIDYLKYDNCFNEGQSGTPKITFDRYKKMSDALNATGRPILYSMCNWGEDYPWKWAQTVANSWRMSGDIADLFDREDPRCPCTGDQGYDCALPGFHCSMANILNKVSSYVDKGIPGAWNDLDMLEVGNGGMTDDEYKIHFTMWAAVKSPLIMGNNLAKLDGKAYSILTNPAIIAISQDPMGSAAVRRTREYADPVNKKGELQMWSGALANYQACVFLINFSDSEKKMDAKFEDIFVDVGLNSVYAKSSWYIHDLWANRMPEAMAGAIISGNGTQGQNISSYYYNATQTSFEDGINAGNPLLMGKRIGSVEALGTISATVPAHGIVAYRLVIKDLGGAKDEL